MSSLCVKCGGIFAILCEIPLSFVHADIFRSKFLLTSAHSSVIIGTNLFVTEFELPATMHDLGTFKD